ncbi:MAG: transketolase C-terminal domain-containing protein, partial [Chlamydiota bacterium]
MRNTFADEIFQLATVDPRIVLLSGDIGNRLFDSFKQKFPHRFYNCGIAEANMTSLAAGLGMCGLLPITYTIAPFNTIRCLEQIRIDICYHQVPAIIVGTGAGLSYASLGATHCSCDDIALLKSIPNMTVLCPADSFELKRLLHQSLSWNSPIYLRIGKKGEPMCYKEIPNLTIGKGHVFQKGKDICLITTGNTLSIAMEVAKKLEACALFPQIVSMHTVKPLDTALLGTLAKEFSLLVSIEEHSLIGGLGS